MALGKPTRIWKGYKSNGWKAGEWGRLTLSAEGSGWQHLKKLTYVNPWVLMALAEVCPLMEPDAVGAT